MVAVLKERERVVHGERVNVSMEPKENDAGAVGAVGAAPDRVRKIIL